MDPRVSIILPCRNRGRLLAESMASFQVQNYPNLEVVVVEDGDEDGITKDVAAQYGAKYIRLERTEKYPSFQSVARVFNVGIKASTGDILILQAPETKHIGDVIRSMVAEIAGDSRRMAVVETFAVDSDGHILNALGRSAGASPRALHKQMVTDVGGFEESFFGYGYEDDFFSWLLERNGIKTSCPAGVSAAHLWHPATEGAFDKFTGHANRARCWGLSLAVIWEHRPARANLAPLECTERILEPDIQQYVKQARATFSDTLYQQWTEDWLRGDRNDDVALDARVRATRTLDLVSQRRPAYFAARVADAAWALIWARRCAEEVQRTTKSDPVWAARVKICQDCHESLAAISVRVIKRILNGEVRW